MPLRLRHPAGALLVALSLALAAAPAAAQLRNVPRFEVTPMLGGHYGGVMDLDRGKLRIGTDPAIGLVAGWRWREDVIVELEYRRQGSTAEMDNGVTTRPLFDLAVQYLLLGGSVMPLGELYGPYFTGGVGAAIYAPDGGLDSKMAPAGAFGGGYRWRLSPRLGAKAQGRFVLGYPTSGKIFCGETAGCFTNDGGDPVVQLEASAGLMIVF